MKASVAVLCVVLLAFVTGTASAQIVVQDLFYNHRVGPLNLPLDTVLGTVSVEVVGSTALYDVYVDTDLVGSAYGMENGYIRTFSFESAISFPLENITVTEPEGPWSSRSPGADLFDYAVWRDHNQPASPFFSMEIRDLPGGSTVDDFLAENWLIEDVYGFRTPWCVQLRFDDYPEGTPGSMYLYSGRPDGPGGEIPEPSTALLLLPSLAAFVVWRRRV